MNGHTDIRSRYPIIVRNGRPDDLLPIGITMASNITVFSKPDCVQCDGTLRALAKRGIQHKTVDLTQNPEAVEKVRDLGHQRVPVVLVEDTDGRDHWSGFRPDRISALSNEASTRRTATLPVQRDSMTASPGRSAPSPDPAL